MLAGTLVQGHFDYAATSWYEGLLQTLKNKLHKALNKFARIILKFHPVAHVELDHFKSREKGQPY